MKKYKDLLSELPSKSVVVTYGQFNPPTVEHELIVKVVRKLAKQRKADHIVFVSSIQDKKNPLEFRKKIQYLELMFPNTRFVASNEDFIKSLKRYKNVVAVTSADNVESFKKLIKRGSFESVEVIPAGQKCPDSNDRAIKFASKGDLINFKKSLPTTVRELDAKRLLNDVRSGLGLESIKEHINFVKDDLREQYFRGELFNEGDIVESNEVVYKIIKRGSNHLLLQNEDGSKVSKWIQDVHTTERKFMLKQLQESVSVNPQTTDTNKDLEKANQQSEVARQMAKNAEEKAKLVVKQKRDMDNLKSQLRNEDSQVVNTKSNYNIAKSVMSLSDFRKSMSQAKPEGDAEEKELEKKTLDGLIGNTHMDGGHVRKMKIKHHLGESSYNHDDNRTGFAKRSAAWHADGGANDEGHPPEKFKAKSTMDRPHTVHIGGKPWKKFDNGHQAHAAARTLQSKGKDAVAIAHFREETEEEKGDRKTQLKRFKGQAADAKLGTGELEEARMSAAVKLQRAFEREQAKSEVSRKRGEEVMAQAKADAEKKQEPVKEEFDDISDDELQALIEADLESLTEEDFFEAYDDDELAIIDDETGEEIEAVAEEAQFDVPALMEVLSRMERIKAKARMRRSQAKRQRREKIALKQFSTPQVANKRARRMAISAMKKRLLRGQNPQKVSIGQKERVERFIAQRKKVVDRLSARMVSRVRQVEKARMAHKKYTKNNGVAF
jgi:hypothetical protein